MLRCTWLVQLVECAGHNSFAIVPRPPLRQNRFADPRHEERVAQVSRIEMKQQVRVVLPVGRQAIVEDEPRNGFGLLAIGKRGRRLAQFGEPPQQPLS